MKNIFIISHRRSGTHLLIDSILNNINSKKKYDFFNLDKYNKEIKDKEFNSLEQKINNGCSIIKTHTDINIEKYFQKNNKLISVVKKNLNEAKIIYIYRDGRDVMNSLYHYISSYSEIIENISFSEFIKRKTTIAFSENRITWLEYWVNHVSGWIKEKEILLVKFEDLLMNYDETIKEIFNFIEEDLKKDMIDVRRSQNEKGIFKKIKKIFLKEIIIHSSIFFRKGISGDYANIFKEKDYEYFQKVAGNLQKELKYE